MNKFLILFPTTSLGLVTSGCGLFNHDLLFGLDFAKSLPISNSYSKSPSPVLQYLTEHKDNSQLKFTTPQYQDDNQAVFDWLATRVVSVILVSYDYSKHDYQLSFGTATILGAANQQTKAGKDLAFYLASNYHVFAGLEHKYSQSKRQKPVGFYFGFNHYFQKLIQDKKHPSQQDLQSKSDDLFLTKPDYYPITFDPLFGVYFANNVSVYGVNNLAQKQSSFNNLKFAADFAVIKVNFSSALHSSVGSRFLRKTSGRKQAINHYVKQLKNNITEYGDLTFSSKDLKSGYMMSYPYVDSPKKDQNLTISVNLELKNLPVPTMKMVINNNLD